MAETVKTAIVTGGGSGIGRAVALAFGRDGYKVLITGRRQEPLDETIALQADAAMTAFPADVSREADVDALFSHAKSQLGRLDVIFNNAGTGAPAAPGRGFGVHLLHRRFHHHESPRGGRGNRGGGDPARQAQVWCTGSG